MSNTGVQKMRGRFATIFAVAMLLAGASMLIGSAASAHTPDGSLVTDLIEGNQTQEDAGDAYISVDGDTVSVHWHLTGDFEGAEVSNQFVCVGSYEISPANQRCKPGQAPVGTVFSPDPIGSSDWSFEYAGDKSAFQLHISINCECGSSLLANWEDPGSSDDGSADDGSSDDGSADDGSSDDGSSDDGSSDDGSSDDGSSDDGSSDDGSSDDGTVDDGTVDDGSTDDGSTDGTDVQGNTVTKPKPKPKADVQGDQLAQTGPETTMLTIIGLVFLMLGVAMRFGKFATPLLATGGHDAKDLVAEALRRRARGWTCKG